MPTSRPRSRSGWWKSSAALAALLLSQPLLPPPPAAADAGDVQRLNEEGNAFFKDRRYAEALVRFEAALTLSPENPTLRRNVAEACAALGSEASGASRWQEAGKRFARASDLAPEDARFPLWLGIAREEEGAEREAEAAYRKALGLAPGDPKALARLGRLLLRQNRLKEAVPALEKAAALAPGDEALGSLLAQAQRDLAFEGGLSESGVSLFDVAFDGATNAGAAQRILSELLLAQTEISNDLGLTQRGRVRVILYTAREYADVTQAPEWAAAHYDGKIRLPIKDMDRREREIRATLYHEYTHALLHEALPDCPSWLHEGLAQAAEFGRVLGRDAEAARLRPLAALKAEAWIPLAELDAPIAGIRDPNRVSLAYAESLSFVRYLEVRFGQSAMQVFLSRWQSRPRQPYREAFRDAYGFELEELEKDWRAAPGRAAPR